MGVQNQQLRLQGAGCIFLGQLPASDLRNVGQAGVARVLLDEITHIFTHQNPAKLLLQLSRQPALATRLRPGQYDYFHVRSAGSARQSRQP